MQLSRLDIDLGGCQLCKIWCTSWTAISLSTVLHILIHLWYPSYRSWHTSCGVWFISTVLGTYQLVYVVVYVAPLSWCQGFDIKNERKLKSESINLHNHKIIFQRLTGRKLIVLLSLPGRMELRLFNRLIVHQAQISSKGFHQNFSIHFMWF